MDNGNPALRLYEIINSVTKFQSNTEAKKVWCEIFDIEDSSSPELYASLAEVIALAKETQKLMSERHPHLSTMTAHWVNQLKTAFNELNLTGNIHSFNGNITNESKNYLHAAATILGADLKDLTKDEISSIKELLKESLTGIEDSQIEEKVKEYLRSSVHEILKNLDNYFVTGKVPVVRSIEQAIGHIFMHEETREAAKTSAGAKFMVGLAAAANAVTVLSPAVPAFLALLGTQAPAIAAH